MTQIDYNRIKNRVSIDSTHLPADDYLSIGTNGPTELIVATFCQLIDWSILGISKKYFI